MNKRSNPLTSAFTRLCARLMVLIFLAIPLTEAFHYHPKEFSFSNSSGKAFIQKHHVHCKICDYLLQVHSHQLHYGSLTAFKVVLFSSCLSQVDPVLQVAIGFKISHANIGLVYFNRAAPVAVRQNPGSK